MNGDDNMEKVFTTAQVAKIIGIHPNTVRLYEELKLISPPGRKLNGYRMFTKFHIEQFKIARLAFQVEVLQNGLRKQAVDIVKASAACDFGKALCLTQNYLLQIENEKKNAEEAIRIVEQLLSGSNQENSDLHLTRKDAADYLHITIDTLRNWELNGLLTVKRKQNGYRIYTDTDIKRLKIIRSLRCANYSLSAILRMLQALSHNPQANIRTVINTPSLSDDIISACDNLLTSLNHAKKNARTIYRHLEKIQKDYISNPPF